MKQTRITKNQLREMIKEAVLKEQQSIWFTRDDLHVLNDLVQDHMQKFGMAKSSSERQYQVGAVDTLKRAIKFINSAQDRFSAQSKALGEQLSRKAAPLPKWGVHSTPEKSPWGIKEPSEWYPEDDGFEDSDLEPFPWEQEVYDKHNASMSEQHDFNDAYDAYDEEEEKAEIERVGLVRYEKNLDDLDHDRMKNRKK